VFVMNRIESGDSAGAAAVAVVLLVVSFALLLAIGGIRYLVTGHERA
jgi:ABC-type sulfate transport system permease component